MIRSRILIALALAPVVLATTASSQNADGVYAEAEALLTAGKLKAARSLLEASLDTTPDDPRALLLLGRVHFAWPVVGRYEAKKLFERTAALTPDDPEPLYWLMRVGMELKDAEGEQLAWKSIARVWALDPDYRDTWAVWRRMYHGSGQLRQALDVLSRHAGNLVVDFRRAQLQLELGQLREADSMLADLISRSRSDGGVWALRAEIAFALSDTAAGTARYARAVESAATDTLDVLWQQIASIASSREKATYTRTPAERRPAFLRAFWALRDPDLTTAANERLAEHFGRLAYARRHYRLRFPWSRIHYSPEYRALNAQDLAAYMLRRVKTMSGTVGRLPELSPDEERRQLLGLGVSLRDVPEPDSVTRYVQLGLDGRGVAYVRFGPPKRMLVDLGGMVERWEYEAGGGRFSLSFAVVGGDYILSPVSPLELDNIKTAVELDSTSVAAPLELQAWTTCFRAPTPGLLLLYIGMDADTAGTAAWGAADSEVARVQGSPPLALTLPPGSYRIGADGKLGGRLGRLRTRVDAPDLWRDSLAVSGLLAAPLPPDSVDRDAIIRSMPAPLRFAADEPLLLYAEVYGLGSASGRALYTVEYEFVPADSASLVSLRFSRHPPAAGTTEERLVIAPGQVARGRYAITLRVRDEIRGREAGSSRIYVELW
jgi:tetratricopeptide (TPR) repeat protein